MSVPPQARMNFLRHGRNVLRQTELAPIIGFLYHEEPRDGDQALPFIVPPRVLGRPHAPAAGAIRRPLDRSGVPVVRAVGPAAVLGVRPGQLAAGAAGAGPPAAGRLDPQPAAAGRGRAAGDRVIERVTLAAS